MIRIVLMEPNHITQLTLPFWIGAADRASVSIDIAAQERNRLAACRHYEADQRFRFLI
jgi:hypothetical protein